MEILVPGYTIRPVVQTEDDLENVLSVYRQCEDFLSLGPVAVASMEMVLSDLALSNKEASTFCAIEDNRSGEVVGVLNYTLSGFEGKPGVGFLYLLMIAAPHRRRGLGAAVVRAVEDAMRRDGGAEALEAGVQENNPDAIRFWQRMGFTIVSGPDLFPDGTTAFHLWKKV